MNINFKYFIVSIAGIFLALGIGIIVGFNLSGDKTITDQNKVMIDEINQKVEDQKKESERTSNLYNVKKEQNENLADYILENKDFLLNKALDTKQIGLISFAEKDNSNLVTEQIENSGGNVLFNIKIKKTTFNEEEIKKFNEVFSKDVKNTGEVVDFITETIKLKDNKDVLNKLKEINFINFENDEYVYDNCNSIVFIANMGDEFEDAFNNIEKQFLQNLGNDKYSIIVTDSEDKDNKMNKFVEEKVAVVTGIDKSINKYAMVLLLKDENKVGNFGQNDFAKTVLPLKNN